MAFIREGETKRDMEHRMEKRAREIAREHGRPEGLWQLFLGEAYNEAMLAAKAEREEAEPDPDHAG